MQEHVRVSSKQNGLSNTLCPTKDAVGLLPVVLSIQTYSDYQQRQSWLKECGLEAILHFANVQSFVAPIHLVHGSIRLAPNLQLVIWRHL